MKAAFILYGYIISLSDLNDSFQISVLSECVKLFL